MIRCLHCQTNVALETDVVALREHAMTCEKSPAVRELAKSRAIVEQAQLIARRWDTQDGVNGAELDTLRDIVFDRPRAERVEVQGEDDEDIRF